MDLYSKIDNIKFYLMLPATINDKILVWKKLFFFFEGGDPAKYNCTGQPAFKCKRHKVDWP